MRMKSIASMRYDKVHKNPKQLLSLTGFTVDEFKAFLPTFKYHWDEYYYNRKTSQLPVISDKLLFILSYLKNNPLQEYRGAILWQDTGFIGHKQANATVMMPTKKPKGKELSDGQKEENRNISSFRILVEHAIGGIKKCRIVKDRFRCRKFGFDDLVMFIACGLHNFRISLKMNCI